MAIKHLFDFLISRNHFRKNIDELADLETNKSTELGISPYLAQVWAKSDFEKLRKNLKLMAMGFTNHAGIIHHASDLKTNRSAWEYGYDQVISNEHDLFRTDRFDDETYYFLLQTVLAKLIKRLPIPVRPETVGGLVRDWFFAAKIRTQLCTAARKKKKRIIVNLGYAHTTRVAELLKENLGYDYPIRYFDGINAKFNIERIHNQSDKGDPANPYFSYVDYCKELYGNIVNTNQTIIPSQRGSTK